jgi:hypothetical protein
MTLFFICFLMIGLHKKGLKKIYQKKCELCVHWKWWWWWCSSNCEKIETNWVKEHVRAPRILFVEAKEGNLFSRNELLEILFLKKKEIWQRFIWKLFKTLLNQWKVKFMDSKQWKKERKTRKRGDGEKICDQGSMSSDGGRATQLLVVGHPFDRVDSW